MKALAVCVVLLALVATALYLRSGRRHTGIMGDIALTPQTDWTVTTSDIVLGGRSSASLWLTGEFKGFASSTADPPFPTPGQAQMAPDLFRSGQ